MKSLTNDEYLHMREGAEVTAADEHGDKVLKLADGTYLKLFRVKRLFTSARLFPYWRRFEKNAEALHALKVPTLKVIESFSVPVLDRTAVHYQPLPGNTLREVPDIDASLVARLGVFIGDLHDKGVYLRSMHLGNIVRTPQGDLGLIDIADMKVYGRPLRTGLRIRNFRHLWRYEEDRRVISHHHELFVSSFDPGYRDKIARMFRPE